MGKPKEKGKILNPKTGRMVAKDGAIGRALRLAKAVGCNASNADTRTTNNIRRPAKLETSDDSEDDSSDVSESCTDGESCADSRIDGCAGSESGNESRVDSESEFDSESHVSDTDHGTEEECSSEDAEAKQNGVENALLKRVDTKNFKLDGRILPFARQPLPPPPSPL